MRVVFNYFKREKQGSSVSGRSRRVSSPTPASLAPDTKLSTLQWILDVKRGHESQDLTFVRKQEQEFDTKSKSAVAEIFLNPNFQRWMTADSPDFIYIEGRLERQYGKTSPISYFCAELVYKFKESPPTTITLHFFCGQHVAFNDQLRGPRGLMRSLIAQFLRVRPMVSLDDLDLMAFNGNHESIPMEELCYLFQMIVGQIPPQYMILCIIDDISRLEKDEWSEEYWTLMRMLEDVVNIAEAGVRFRVLMTSPGRSKWLRGDREVLADHRVLVTDSGLQMSRPNPRTLSRR